MDNFTFPFTAIVGQEKIKKSLILNAINPSIGGVLIKGDKGTGKTTAVRALADLLPSIKVVKGCPFNCDPDDKTNMCPLCKSRDKIKVEKKKMKVVELPLGATEDRVVGTLDIKKALNEGIKALEPGLLAEANRNILYVDEINLLDDHLVDVLLDAAAYGINRVEREGISISHPSRFILVGTMNPAEGELRPQLADRIGLHITAKSITDIKDRVKIMERRERFERDPIGFREEFKDKQEKLRKRILKARKLLDKVEISQELMELIARVCLNAGVDGHRADIAILKTSKTIAAYNGRKEVNIDDIKEAISLVLEERILGRKLGKNQISKVVERAKEEMKKDKIETSAKARAKELTKGSGEFFLGSKSTSHIQAVGKRNIEDKDVNIDLKKILKFKGDKRRRKYGNKVESQTERGKYVKSRIPLKNPKDIAIDATIRAAAIKSEGKIKVEPEDLREKIRKHGSKALIVLVVDISGSMSSEDKAKKVKGVLKRIMLDAQRHKDKLAIIGFKGREARVILPSTRRIFSFKDKIENISVGGTTPMAHGLKKAIEILKREKKKSNEYVPILVLLSDGMPNIALKNSPTRDVLELAKELNRSDIHTVIINFEKRIMRGRNFNFELALTSGGKYYEVGNRNIVETVGSIIKHERNSLFYNDKNIYLS